MAVTTRAEFRSHATLLFADLCDYTSLTEAADPEEVAPLLRRLREQVEAVVHKHRGIVNEWRGDGVFCIFGLPQASEEDPRHAIEAALEMHRATQAMDAGIRDFEIRLHTGIDAGLVFARERDGQPGYDLIGDAVNTAARLCAHAARDEIWVSRAALDGLAERFETGAMQALALKGKREPVAACQVTGRSAIATRFAASQRRGLTPLVGRDAALASLLAGWQRAQQQRLQPFAVVGSPGIGKTRLLGELKQRAGARVLEGSCESAPSGTPLQPFIDVLRQVFGIRPDLSAPDVAARVDVALPEIDPELGSCRDVLLHLLGRGALPSSSLPELVQQSFVSVLVQLLSALSRAQPLLLLLDDWQWADDMSRQALGNVLRALRETPSMIVMGSRDLGDPLLSSGEVVALEPLTPDQSAQVIAAILPYSLNLGLTRSIHERAGGNPLFLEELCRALPTEASTGEEDLRSSKVPSTLRGIIQVRTERLPESPARVLQAAAVIGGESPLWLLACVCDAGELDGALRVLAENDLVHSEAERETFRFKHWTTREVVYQSVRLPERRRLHDEIAAALEARAVQAGRPPPYEELAYHLAGSGNFERAAAFAELAGDRASASSSLDHARQQYRAALDALQRMPQTAELESRWVAVVDKWAAASLYSPAEEHLQLIRRAGELSVRRQDLPSAARADYWLSWFCYALGDQQRAIQYCRSGLARAEAASDQTLAGHLVLSLGQSLAAAGEYGEALAHFDAALAVKRQAFRARQERRAGERRAPLAFAYALACKGLLHGDLGQFAAAYACFDEALAALHGTGHAVEGSCLGLLGMVQLLQGRWLEALETAQRAQTTAERVNGPYVYAMSRTVSGYARWISQRSPDALAELKQAVKWLEGRGIRLFISFNYAFLADALASADDVAGARDYAERALARAGRADHLGETMAHRTLARLGRAASSEHAEALRHLEQAMGSARARQSAREVALTDLELATLYQARGERERAAQSVISARRIFSQLGMDYYEREALRITADS